MSLPRVVFDTNVVLSALVFRGALAQGMRASWRDGCCTPLASSATIQELVRVLSYPKFRLSHDEQHELLADYLPHVQTVKIPSPPPQVPQCRDPFDLPFLELAVAGGARYLVSGDADLLAVASTRRLAILEPARWLAMRA